MLKAITSVSAVLLFVKIIGFIKQAVIAAYFGATGQTDIYTLIKTNSQNVNLYRILYFTDCRLQLF